MPNTLSGGLGVKHEIQPIITILHVLHFLIETNEQGPIAVAAMLHDKCGNAATFYKFFDAESHGRDVLDRVSAGERPMQLWRLCRPVVSDGSRS